MCQGVDVEVGVDRADVRTEVALDLQDQAPDLALRIARLAAERLFDGRIQTG